MSREEILLRGLSTADRIIEIGPSYSPLAPKRDGWNVFTIDHASREDLVRKYVNEPSVDTSRIEDVDAVWSGGSLAESVPEAQHGTFDAFIASHVIEHTTDVVSFLRSAETVLRPGGVIVLAVPDKRKCFDFYRTPSTTAQAIAAFEERRTRHAAGTHFDHWMYMARKDPVPGWTIDDTRPFRFDYPEMDPFRVMGYAESSDYVDAHSWVWVPASFELMILELAQFGYLGCCVEATQEAPAIEFYARLRKGFEPLPLDALNARRLVLLNRALVEIAEQTRQIPDSPLAAASRALQAR